MTALQPGMVVARSVSPGKPLGTLLILGHDPAGTRATIVYDNPEREDGIGAFAWDIADLTEWKP